MRSPDVLLIRWLHPLVFGAWMAALVYLLGSRRYIDFLRPEFGWLLVPAIFIAMGFMIAALAASRHLQASFSMALRAAVLLLPLLYLGALPNAMLGGSDFKNRFVGTGEIGSRSRESSGERFPWEEGRNEDGASQLDTSDSGLTSDGGLLISDLYRQADRYDGQQVVFSGMIMRDAALQEHFGGRDTAIYRFLITCCAADALPLAIAVDSDRAAGFYQGPVGACFRNLFPATDQ